MNNKGKGALGEYLAVDFLKKKGYKILSTNANFCGCELDVVAIKTIKVQKKQIKIEYKNSEVKILPFCLLVFVFLILVYNHLQISESNSKKLASQ